MAVNDFAAGISLHAPSKSVTATSAAASAVTLTIPAPGNTEQNTVITGITLSCSGAGSTGITVTVKDASTTVAVLDHSLTALTPVALPLAAPITIGNGNASSVVVSAGASTCVVRVNASYMTV